MISLGGLWLCLWRGPWRRWGLAAVVAGFATMPLTRPPDVVIADGGRFVAARATDGRYFVSADKNEDRAIALRPEDRRRLGTLARGRRAGAGSIASKIRAATRRVAGNIA